MEQTIIPQYSIYNHGRWAILLKPGLEFIGWCGLKARPERSESDSYRIDLGYRLIKKAWGNGYATEAAYACIKYGFEKLNLNRIVGRAMPGNLASLKVLENCSMSYIGEEIVDGHPSKTYEALNPFIT